MTGMLALVPAGGRVVANLLASACYVGVVALFYLLFRPVSAGLSMLTAVIGLLGCIVGALGALNRSPLHINSLVFFGFYCLLIGWLIFSSTFLPRVLGVLMAIGGLGWLTFASTALADRLSPFNMIPGVVGEGALTLWLLAAGVNAERWRARAHAEDQ